MTRFGPAKVLAVKEPSPIEPEWTETVLGIFAGVPFVLAVGLCLWLAAFAGRYCLNEIRRR